MKGGNSQVADVGFVLEGTYPYVMGGVSSWIDQIIRGLPDVTFSLLFLGSTRELAQDRKYTLPPNVIAMEEAFLHERLDRKELTPADTPEELRNQIYDAIRKFYLDSEETERLDIFWRLVDLITDAGDRFTFGNLTHDVTIWEILEDAYDRFCPEESFIDFFWTVRFLHLPTWNMIRAVPKIPPARVYHSPSAGYAGVVAAIGAHRFNSPFLLTEHGIYTKERIAEISQAEWIYEGDLEQIDFSQGLGKLKQLWIENFKLQGHIAYETAASIITLYEGNVLTQVEFGADRRKTSIIPNGIDPSRFDGIRDQIQSRWNPEPPVKRVGFIGRVVPIKDVKTLLRAARQVVERMPNVEFLIAGPYDEDPAYFEECQKIVKLLNIDKRVLFLGPQKLMDILPRMDVMVLTSISEGLPLVALEAMAASIPLVATDVGACRELVFGRTADDKALGRSGRLTKILSPQETALALISILENPEAWRKLGAAGRMRAEKFYSMSTLLLAYRDLYRKYGQRSHASEGPRSRMATKT